MTYNVFLEFRNGDTREIYDVSNAQVSGQVLAIFIDDSLELIPLDLIQNVRVDAIEQEQPETVEADVEPLFE